MKKIRFLALLLALCLVGSVLLMGCKKDDNTPPEEPNPPPASGEPEKPKGVTEGNFTYYELEDGTWAVIASTGSVEGALTLPSTFREKAVTQIGLQHPTATDVYYGFAGLDGLAAITIPASIKTVLPYAFTACETLHTVTFATGAQVTSIGAYAFAECAALTAIALPEGLLTLGESAFADCTELRSISLPTTLATLGDRALEDCNKLIFVTNLSTITVTGLSDFAEVRTDTDTPFTSTLTTNSDGVQIFTANGKQYLFGFTDSDTKLDLSAMTFTAIFPGALMDNKTLTEVALPASVTEIGAYAFSGCAALTKVSFATGSALATIGDAAFDACRALHDLALPEGLESIGYRAFCGCEALTKITIPASVTEIGDTAFAACHLLKDLTFAEDSELTLIGSQAFLSCEALATVALPEKLAYIGEAAFGGCTALTAVSFTIRSGWQLTPAPEGGTPDLSNTANNVYYLTDLYLNCLWTKGQ